MRMAIEYNEGTNLTGAQFQEIYGSWRMFSVGPDKRWNNSYTAGGTSGLSSPSTVGRPYDPTNGTISLGSIVRSQKQPEANSRWVEVPGT